MSETTGPTALAGRLEESSFPEILRRVLDEGRTGTLSLVRPGEEIQLFFEDGELRTAISTAEGRRLGDTLRRRGVITEEAFAAANDEFQEKRHGRFGKFLLAKGLISEADLRSATRAHFEEIVSSAFEWAEGTFSFEESSGRLDPDVTLPLSVGAILVAGIRRLPESERFMDLLGDLDRFALALPSRFEGEDAIVLESNEAYLHSLCDGKTRLRSVLKLSPSRLAGARSLYALMIGGLLRLTPEQVRATPVEPIVEAPEEVWSGRGEPDLDVRAHLARSNYLEAKRLLEKRDYYGAIVLLQESVRLVPENSEYHFRLAGALAKNSRWRVKAGHHYSQALILDPVRQEVMREYAEFLAECGRYREGQAIARRLVERYPDDPRNQEVLARCNEGALGEDEPVAEISSTEDKSAAKSIFGLFRGRRKDSEE